MRTLVYQNTTPVDLNVLLPGSAEKEEDEEEQEPPEQASPRFQTLAGLSSTGERNIVVVVLVLVVVVVLL